MENRKKKNNIIGIIAIIVVLIAGGLDCKFLIDTTNEAYSYDVIDELENFADDIDKQTKEYEKRAEEAREKLDKLLGN